MSKITFNESRTLKLTNVLKYKLLLDDENLNLDIVVGQMQTYIQTKGAKQIGPLIQYSKTALDEAGNPIIDIYLMLQADTFIHNVEFPYAMDSIIKIPDAMYCRYNGPESKLRFSYDKICLEAFERDIELSDVNYTIFVSQDQDKDIITADVFAPKKK